MIKNESLQSTGLPDDEKNENSSRSMIDLEIRRIIDNVETYAIPSTITYLVYRDESYLPRETKKYIEKSLAEDTLIDLGCGEKINSVNAVIELACNSGAREYIGVDKYNLPDDQNLLRQYDGKINYCFVQQDMLEFLLNQPNNSANLILNSIDSTLFVDVRGDAAKKYLDTLVKEMVRVVGSDHIVFGLSADVIFEGLLKNGFRQVYDAKSCEVSVYKLKERERNQ